MWRNREKRKRIDSRYEVGSDGVVYSDGMPLVPVRGEWVSLHGERRLVSYLVARAFVPNQEGRLYVRHRNGDRRDNRAENLEWTDSKEAEKRGPKERMVPIGQYDAEGNRIAVYGCVSDAARRTGIKAELIRAALRRGRGRTGGYYWVYML